MAATAKVFKNGRSQAVRLPAEFRFQGSEVNIRRDPLTGEVILSEKSARTGSLDTFFKLRNSLGSEDIPDDFMGDREQGTSQRDDMFDDV